MKQNMVKKEKIIITPPATKKRLIGWRKLSQRRINSICKLQNKKTMLITAKKMNSNRIGKTTSAGKRMSSGVIMAKAMTGVLNKAS
jgi:hypothetical protein